MDTPITLDPILPAEPGRGRWFRVEEPAFGYYAQAPSEAWLLSQELQYRRVVSIREARESDRPHLPKPAARCTLSSRFD